MESVETKRLRDQLALLRAKIAVHDAEGAELACQEAGLLSALSPFNFLPDELVALILVHASCYAADGNADKPYIKPLRQFPFLLLTVCRRWHQIAYSAPSFWALYTHRSRNPDLKLSSVVWNYFLNVPGRALISSWMSTCPMSMTTTGQCKRRYGVYKGDGGNMLEYLNGEATQEVPI